ncbi:MAG: hypothetical protein FJ102_24115 [Deltaproteobacteria bacterium]|nr:hypothetical protein [Deltaproteobacteria bacterium]
MILFLACAPGVTVDSAPEAEVSPLVPLDAPRLLRRVSLDLRGTLPSVAELDAVEADPSALESIVPGYLESATTEDRLVSLLAERWHTVLDAYEVGTGDYGLPMEENDNFAHAVGEEPLRLVARVVTDDLPYSTIVTADYTMANELLAGIWPIDYPEGSEGWVASRYTDGRPAAGVLSTNGFYWRYVTNTSNKNRGRVAAISRLLLCADVLSRPVVFERSDDPDPETAVRTEPTCLACHAALDPVAAGLFGFWWTIQYNPYEMQVYHPERERLGTELLGTEPGWYGIPTSGLVDMGWYIARDPRFARCAAESWASSLWRRPVTIDDYATVETLRANYVASEESPRSLLLDVLATAEYRADDARLLSPNQQRLLLEDLVGLDWTETQARGLENDLTGYRVLAGGVDGYSVTRPQAEPGLTWMLVNQRVAQMAACTLVARDLDQPGAESLTVPSTAAPGDDAFDAQLRALYWQLYAERPGDDWVVDTGALWTAVAAEEGAAEAWMAVIEAMLRDPLMVTE